LSRNSAEQHRQAADEEEVHLLVLLSYKFFKSSYYHFMQNNRKHCFSFVSVLLIRFVKLLERYSKKLKEHKELSKQYIEIVMRLLDCWGKAPSQIMLKQNILLILKNFKRILMS